MADRPGIDETRLEALGEVLRRAAGLSISPGMRRGLPSVVADVAAGLGEPPAAALTRLLDEEPLAVEALVERTVVGETHFWRHPEQLRALRKVAFGAPEPLSIWSAGCASGEEPYSVAMALREAGRAGRGDRILATDVSARALDRARAGRYAAWSLRRLPRELRERYLPGEPPEAEVAPEVREPVELLRHNLVADPPPGSGFDVVLCRNVLIYFDPVLAAEVLYRLLGATRPGGLLVLGPVELPLAAQVDVEWVTAEGASLLRRRLEPPPPR